MRIQTLTLKDFRSHHETVLELDRFNFVRGTNACGKTSIQMALEFLFTGQCVMTDAAGRGAEALIRAGAKEFGVSATLEKGETVCRRRSARSHSVELNGNRVPVEAAAAFLEKQFASADVLSAVLNAGRFVEMSEAEQKRLLAQVVDAGKMDIPDEISEAIRTAGSTPPKVASVADVETTYKRFYDLRTEANRAMKTLGQVEKPDTPTEFPNSQEVKKKLDELRHQKERIIAQKAETAAAWETAQKRLKQVQAEMEEVSSELLRPSEEQELLQLGSHRDYAEKLQQELTELIAQRKALETALEAMEGLKGQCPTCRQPISPEVKTAEMKKLRDRLADLEGMIQGTKEEVSEYADIEAARSRLEQHRKALARQTKLVEEQSELLRVAKPNAADLESRLALLTERIRKGERVLETAQQAEADRERWQKYLAEKSALETRSNLLDQLVEFFGSNGAMRTQATSRMESFTEKLNLQLAAFGYRCSLALDPFEIRVGSAPNQEFELSLRQLSESEQFRFSIAFQVALAMATGLRFVVIDRADVLDKERRKMLTRLLLTSELDQAIVLATSEEAAPMNVPIGVKFFELASRDCSNEVRAPAAA